MKTHVLLDVAMINSVAFYNLQIYINALLNSDAQAILKIICAGRAAFDFSRDDDLIEALNTFLLANAHQHGITTGNIGCSLMDLPDEILIIQKENKAEYSNIVFVSRQYKVKINAYSEQLCNGLKMCCEATGGIYMQTPSISNFLSILGMSRALLHDRNASNGDSRTKVNICPLCLELYSAFVPICKKCKIKFKFSK